MIILLYFAIVLLTIILSVTITNIILGPSLKKAPLLTVIPKVSVLIPARNEEKNIGKCLSGILAQDYKNFEVIVLDDNSKDDTAKIVQTFAQRDARVQLLHGKNLPQGWIGKNWACHQLSQQANGDILIFTDADNRHEKFVISNTVAFMQKYELDMLSSFPQQKTVTLAEKMIVPIVDFFVYGTLPLWFTYYAPNPSLAAANGQWIAFKRQSYERIGGHQAVKDHLVEDTELSRIAKRKNMKILTTAGTNAVYCRMYSSAKEVWEGFSKNFYGLTGYHDVTFFSIIFLLCIGFLLPYFLWIFPSMRFMSLTAIGLNLILRSLLAWRYKHPFLISVILHPISIGYAILIGLNSFFSIKKGSIRWKGREIKIR